MKVLHVSRTMGYGGAEKVVYQLCKDNHDVEQLVVSCGGRYVPELEKLGIRHFMIPDMDKKNIWLMLKTLIVLSNIIKRERIDVIHTHHRMAAFYARIVSTFHRCKCVYTAHNVFYGKRFLLRFALKHSKVVAVGDGVKKNLIEEYQLIGDEITVIHNSVRNHVIGCGNILLENLRKDKENVLAGTICRLTRQKGVDIFIKAVKETQERVPNLIGIIIGDGEERTNLENLVNELKLENIIHFLGYQPDALSIINQLDFVVLSSRWEGLPLTPIEVFSQGKTIIVSDIPGNNEVVSDNYNGLLFEKDNIQELSSKIVELCQNKEKRKELEGNAKNTYNEDYSYEKFIKAYNDVYYAVQEG